MIYLKGYLAVLTNATHRVPHPLILSKRFSFVSQACPLKNIGTSNLLYMPSAGILTDFGKGSSSSRYEFGKYSAVRTEHSVGIKFLNLIFGLNQNCPT